MAFDVRVSGEHARVILSGDVDLQTTSDLKAEITKIAGVTQLEIDASSVTYIDSSGVAVLLMARQFCSQQNITMTLPSVSAAVFRVLEIAKLDKILPIGQVVSSADSGVMGVTDAGTQAAPDVSDDDLAAELLGSAPAVSAPAAPAPTTPAPAAPAQEEASEGAASDGDGPTISPGSFG
ncbi:MAG: STAS domain-containing protein [Candidatus Puniceispirillaceae bacterium]